MDKEIEIPDKFCGNEYNDLRENVFNASQENKYTDLVLLAGEIRIPASTAILVTESQYFALNLESNNKKEIKIDDVPGNILKDIVKYFYTKRILLNKKNIVAILSAAKFLQCNSLEKLCRDFLQENINNDNCLQIYHIAKHSKYRELAEKSEEHALNNFHRVSKKRQFLDLAHEDLSDILKKQSIVALNQTWLFEVVVSWLQNDWNEREKYSPNLLKLIKLCELSSSYLSHRAPKIFGRNIECLLLITDALAKINKLNLKDEIDLMAFTQSTPLLVIGERENKLILTSYNSDTSTWSEKPIEDDIIHGFSYYFITFTTNKLFARDSNKFSLYDMTTRKTQTVEFQNENLGCTACFIEDGDNYYVYCIDRSGKMTRWSSNTNSWESMETVKPCGGGSCSIAVVGTKLYVIGGDCQVYDTLSNTWEKCRPLREPRRGLSCIAHGKYIYAVERRNFVRSISNKVFRYDRENDTWSEVASLHTQRDRPALCVYNNKLLVIGGHNGEDWINTVEEYDDDNDKWLTFPSLSSGLSSPSALTHP